jgi:hypothetical protein
MDAGNIVVTFCLARKRSDKSCASIDNKLEARGLGH